MLVIYKSSIRGPREIYNNNALFVTRPDDKLRFAIFFLLFYSRYSPSTIKKELEKKKKKDKLWE